MTNLKSPMRIL